MPADAHIRANRRLWNDDADDYQRRNAPQIRDPAFTGQLAFGLYRMRDVDGTVEFNLPYGTWIGCSATAGWWSRT